MGGQVACAQVPVAAELRAGEWRREQQWFEDISGQNQQGLHRELRGREASRTMVRLLDFGDLGGSWCFQGGAGLG